MGGGCFKGDRSGAVTWKRRVLLHRQCFPRGSGIFSPFHPREDSRRSLSDEHAQFSLLCFFPQIVLVWKGLGIFSTSPKFYFLFTFTWPDGHALYTTESPLNILVMSKGSAGPQLLLLKQQSIFISEASYRLVLRFITAKCPLRLRGALDKWDEDFIFRKAQEQHIDNVYIITLIIWTLPPPEDSRLNPPPEDSRVNPHMRSSAEISKT